MYPCNTPHFNTHTSLQHTPLQHTHLLATHPTSTHTTITHTHLPATHHTSTHLPATQYTSYHTSPPCKICNTYTTVTTHTSLQHITPPHIQTDTSPYIPYNIPHFDTVSTHKHMLPFIFIWLNFISLLLRISMATEHLLQLSSEL